MDAKIIFEDEYMLVVEKPPKVPSQADKTGDIDMLSYLKEYLKCEYPAAKNPYIGLIHRLDRPVGGVMIFAKNKFANTNLSNQLKDSKFLKKYLAVICGEPQNKTGELKDFLSKNEKLNLSKVVSENVKNSKLAVLNYSIIESVHTKNYGTLSLADITLMTGRHHQIRVQFSNIDLPLWGDSKYNPAFAANKKWSQISLWATQIVIHHPKTNDELIFNSKPREYYPFTLFSKCF